MQVHDLENLGKGLIVLALLIGMLSTVGFAVLLKMSAPDDDLDRLKRLDGFPITDEQVRSAQERANREPF